MGTTVINVTLNTSPSANPNVVLSNRNAEATSGDTIRWQSAGTGFTVTSLDPHGDGEAFSAPSVGGNGQFLETTYQPPDTSPGVTYSYTLTVTASNGTAYNTTERESVPDAGRPVIRN